MRLPVLQSTRRRAQAGRPPCLVYVVARRHTYGLSPQPTWPPPSEEELVELLLQNLAKLHESTITYDEIKKAYTGVYNVYSWSHNPDSAGSFALFGPGQFSNLYPYLSRPIADSKFHFVGEAASVHHAWIVGALDSAYSAVYKFLYRFKLYHHIAMLQRRWGHVEELETGKHGTVHLQVALGALHEKYKIQV
ncbi:hypothetical protein V2G26_004721 [Clonostachys chloroleuca]